MHPKDNSGKCKGIAFACYENDEAVAKVQATLDICAFPLVRVLLSY